MLTLHRAENTDSKENLSNIVTAIVQSNQTIVFPAHPRTIKLLKQYQLYEKLDQADNIILIEPVSFIDMIVLEKNAEKILTDSGGVQKEAYFYHVPCITLRTETEWVETVESGWNLVADADKDQIVSAIKRRNWPNSTPPSVFGYGEAAGKIIHILNNA